MYNTQSWWNFYGTSTTSAQMTRQGTIEGHGHGMLQVHYVWNSNTVAATVSM